MTDFDAMIELQDCLGAFRLDHGLVIIEVRDRIHAHIRYSSRFAPRELHAALHVDSP